MNKTINQLMEESIIDRARIMYFQIYSISSSYLTDDIIIIWYYETKMKAKL